MSTPKTPQPSGRGEQITKYLTKKTKGRALTVIRRGVSVFMANEVAQVPAYESWFLGGAQHFMAFWTAQSQLTIMPYLAPSSRLNQHEGRSEEGQGLPSKWWLSTVKRIYYPNNSKLSYPGLSHYKDSEILQSI